MQTLLLDRNTWDLVLDVQGNIALASDPYSVAQDVASAVRLFLGELWYDAGEGVPYFAQVLGQNTPLELIKQLFVTAALTVPEVISAQVYFNAINNRGLTGQIQFSYMTPSAAASSRFGGEVVWGVLTFVGTPEGVITFVGSSGLPVIFVGTT